MHPAPSIILFSTLSGLGFGLLFFLGVTLLDVAGHGALQAWGLAYGFAIAGLLASSFHLGNKMRAWRAFSQWRSSWLSREAWLACAALVIAFPTFWSDWHNLGGLKVFGFLGAIFAIGAVYCTAMIYAQLKTVPRWNHWITPAVFLCFALSGGAIVAGQEYLSVLLSLILGATMLASWKIGDRRFVEVGQTLGSATGLDRFGLASVFEQPHTGGNYLMDEMIYKVGRKHVAKLRIIALICAVVIPALAALFFAAGPAALLSLPFYLIGTLAHRWLFFAQAEHVVGLYYGAR